MISIGMQERIRCTAVASRRPNGGSVVSPSCYTARLELMLGPHLLYVLQRLARADAVSAVGRRVDLVHKTTRRRLGELEENKQRDYASWLRMRRSGPSPTS
jgi:hypothetical protein